MAETTAGTNAASGCTSSVALRIIGVCVPIVIAFNLGGLHAGLTYEKRPVSLHTMDPAATHTNDPAAQRAQFELNQILAATKETAAAEPKAKEAVVRLKAEAAQLQREVPQLKAQHEAARVKAQKQADLEAARMNAVQETAQSVEQGTAQLRATTLQTQSETTANPAAEQGDCNEWCETLPDSWTEKCTWHDCSGCVPCGGSAKIIVVASRQRSSSTTMMMSVGNHSCIRRGNEVFNNRGTKERLQSIKIAESPLQFSRWKNPVQYLLAARDAFCVQNPHCRGRCAVVLKLFDDHGIHLKPLRELLSYPGTRTIILERSAAESECSLNWAKLKGDWGTNPDAHKRGLVRPPCPIKASSKYLKKHNAWFDEIRASAGLTSSALDVKFPAVLDAQVYKELIKSVWKVAGFDFV